MELSKDVVEECVELAEKDDKIGGIIIQKDLLVMDFGLELENFERSFYAGSEVESARFFRRDLALRVGGV